MGFILAEGISFCRAGGRTIFLDLSRDRYLGLADAADQSFSRLQSGRELTQADEWEIEDLVQSGLLVRTCDHRLPRACRAPSPQSSLAPANVPVSARMLTLVLWNIVRTEMDMRVRPLASTLRGLRERKTNADFEEAKSIERVQEIAAAFKCCSLIKSALDRCLSRSVAIAHTMIDRSIHPDIIMGVRLQPFSAHCWVQHRGILVNDMFDRVRNYVPILLI